MLILNSININFKLTKDRRQHSGGAYCLRRETSTCCNCGKQANAANPRSSSKGVSKGSSKGAVSESGSADIIVAA
jgi:hypothetical protein